MHKKVIEGSMVAQHIPSTMQITNIMIKHIIVLALSSLSQEFMFFHFQAWEGLINQVRFLQLLPLHMYNQLSTGEQVKHLCLVAWKFWRKMKRKENWEEKYKERKSEGK